MSLKQKNTERSCWIQYILTLVITLLCLVLATLYTYTSFSEMSKQDAIRFGKVSAQKDGKNLGNVLLKNKEQLEYASFIVEEAMKEDSSNQVILQKLDRVSDIFGKLSNDPEFRGIYGYVRGEYVDGGRWVPPEDFEPTKRPWYKEAFKARGKVVLSAPYDDLLTHNTTVSISRRLSDKRSVISVDIGLNKILDQINLSHNDEEGFWLILDKSGLVVGHSDSTQWGQCYLDSAYWGTEQETLGRQALLANGNPFSINYAGKKYIVFADDMLGDWFFVKLSDESILFERVRWILVRNIMLSMLVFLMVCIFCTTGFRNRIRALRASKAKSVFLANMSHEIRTPINGILGMNSIIMKEVRDPVLKDYASNIHSAGQSLLSIVNDVLDISKIESGKMAIHPAEYNLFNVLSDCFNIISPRASAKNLRFSIECDPDIPSGLWGDEVRIRQIISNLLSNAVKYTEYGEVSLSVKYSTVSTKEVLKVDNTISLKIVVRDTGIGIRPEEMNRIFGGFQRTEQRLHKNVEGSGLGLNLTKQLVEMCGGEITVRSRYEEGSTFMVNIPQVVLNVEPMGDFSTKFKQQNSQKISVEDALLAPNARILVVDDVSLNLKVIRGLLKDSRAKVETAVNGAQCLQMVKNKRYDIIFLDHMMPVMDGVETFERMKELGDSFANKNTPVIMLTANAVVGAKESYLTMGFTDYLSKPVREVDLNRMLKRYLPESLILTPEDLVNYTGEISRDEMAESRKTTSLKKEVPEVASPKTEIPKVEPVTPPKVVPEETKANDAPKSKMDALKEILDVQLGLGYCANDEEFFMEMLDEYTEGNKLESICSDFEKQDWKNYQIQVHALKSTSLTIGAKDLSENAKSLEFACKESNFDFVKENHQRVMDMYSSTLKSIKSVLEVK